MDWQGREKTLAVRDELDIPLPAMAPSYRPSTRRREEMDPATRRLAIFAGVIGTALLGLVAVWAFTGHHRGGVPVIEADSRPVKVKPANPGGLQVEGANDGILSGESDGKQTVAPGPEAPAPQALKAQEQATAAPPPAGQVAPAAPEPAQPAEARPLPSLRPHIAARTATVPPGSPATDGNASIRLIPGAKPPGSVATVAPRPGVRPPIRLTSQLGQPALVAQATTTPSAGEQPSPTQTAPASAPVQSEPLQPAAPAPAAPMQAAPAPAPAATVAPPAAAPAAAPPATAHAAPAGHVKRVLVQFAAVDSGEAALREWQRLEKKYPDLFGGHTPNITKTEHDGKTFWRVRTGGFADLTQATLFCQKFKSRGGTCTVAAF
jgi:hypothetical protein